MTVAKCTAPSLASCNVLVTVTCIARCSCRVPFMTIHHVSQMSSAQRSEKKYLNPRRIWDKPSQTCSSPSVMPGFVYVTKIRWIRKFVEEPRAQPTQETKEVNVEILCHAVTPGSEWLGLGTLRDQGTNQGHDRWSEPGGKLGQGGRKSTRKSSPIACWVKGAGGIDIEWDYQWAASGSWEINPRAESRSVAKGEVMGQVPRHLLCLFRGLYVEKRKAADPASHSSDREWMEV